MPKLVSFDLTKRSWITHGVVVLSSGALLAYGIYWLLLERTVQPVVLSRAGWG